MQVSLLPQTRISWYVLSDQGAAEAAPLNFFQLLPMIKNRKKLEKVEKTNLEARNTGDKGKKTEPHPGKKR